MPYYPHQNTGQQKVSCPQWQGLLLVQEKNCFWILNWYRKRTARNEKHRHGGAVSGRDRLSREKGTETFCFEKKKKSSHKNWLPKTQINKVTYMFSQLTMGVMLIRGVNVHFTTRDMQSFEAGLTCYVALTWVLRMFLGLLVVQCCTMLWTEGVFDKSSSNSENWSNSQHSCLVGFKM